MGKGDQATRRARLLEWLYEFIPQSKRLWVGDREADLWLRLAETDPDKLVSAVPFLAAGKDAGDVRGVVFGPDGSLEFVWLRPGDRFYVRAMGGDDIFQAGCERQDDEPPF